MRTLLPLLLLGCGSPLSGDTGDTAPDATSAPCEPGPAGDRLDLPGMCIEPGLCHDIWYAEAEAVLGPADACTPGDYTLLCTWPAHGISIEQPDSDRDGVPDTQEMTTIFDQLAVLEAPYDGTDAAGLGLGVGYGCFVDTLGAPASTETTGAVTEASWTYTDTETSTIAVSFEDGLATRIARQHSWSE